MTSFMRKFLVVLSIYAAGYVVTYGKVYNEQYELSRQSYPSLTNRTWSSSANFTAHPASMVWPVYWPVRLSIWVFS